MLRAFATALALALLPHAAAATVLYKSVDSKGTVMFSDVPPGPGARILEERRLGSPQGGPAAGAPLYGEPGMETDPLLQHDAAIARAAAQVDLAEHALAEARRGLWSPREGLRLEATRMSREDEQRVEFYKRNVKAARHALMDLLRERRNAMARERGMTLASNR